MTKANSEGSRLGKETKADVRSDTLASGTVDKSSSVITQLTKAEALAIAWTGIEVLAKLGTVKLYKLEDGIGVKFLGAKYVPTEGLVEA